MADPIFVTAGSAGQTLQDVIKVGGKAFNFSTLSQTPFVQLSMRAIDGATLLINSSNANLTNGAGVDGAVYRDWLTSEIMVPGMYRAWWTITLAGGRRLDVPEFDITITEHAPGVGRRTGLIARRVEALMPGVVKKLRELQSFGDWELQNRVELAKRRHLPDLKYVAVDSEITLDPIVVDVLSKITAIDIIPTAIEYWMNMRVSAQAAEERSEYPDRIAALQDLYDRLVNELPLLMSEMALLVGIKSTRSSSSGPVTDTAGLPLITPDPLGFYSSFGQLLPRVVTADYFRSLYPLYGTRVASAGPVP
jgi:hypothetical protein